MDRKQPDSMPKYHIGMASSPAASIIYFSHLMDQFFPVPVTLGTVVFQAPTGMALYVLLTVLKCFPSSKF